jgi:hypothetical protein
MAKEYQCRAAETKVSRQIDDSELDELFRALSLFAAAPSPKCIEAMSANGAEIQSRLNR